MRRPFVIAVAGPGSNSGKTHLVCALISHLKQSHDVGAVKVATSTPDHLCARTNLPCDCLLFDGKMRLLKDPAYINRVGKDTALMHEAGAVPVWWLQTTSDVQLESAKFLATQLEGPQLWVIEGSGLIRTNQADLVIVVAHADGRKAKGSWQELVPKADILAISHESAIPDQLNPIDIENLRPEARILHFSGNSFDLNQSFVAELAARLNEHQATPK